MDIYAVSVLDVYQVINICIHFHIFYFRIESGICMGSLSEA